VTAHFPEKQAHEAKWARRIALFSVQLLLLTVILHRFASLSTPAAMNLLAVGVVGLLLAVAVAGAAITRIWFGGQRGARQAFAGIMIALVGLALPLWALYHFIMLPPLTDIETKPGEPLDFKLLASMRPADANRIEEPDGAAVAEQEKAYPDIRSMELERSAGEVFDLVSGAVRRLGWNVALSEPPSENGVGRIEATDRTMIMGFTDDVLVRVTGDDAQALIDVRSVSRYGSHDLGTNAERIRTLFAEVKTELEKKTGLEEASAPKPQPAKKLKIKKRGQKKRDRDNRRSVDQQSPPPSQPNLAR
jgi:Protein of unknown function (DUF1499)